METLPALKITHFNGEPARGQVYAYLRCYVRDGEIPFSVTVFDETPPDTARFGFAVTPDDAAGTYLFASCTKQQGDALWLYRTGEPADGPLRRLEMPPMRHLAGSDEQGFYWGCELLLDEAFSALDYQTRLTVTEDVYRILKQEAITTVMVTHDIPESISMGDRILVLTARPARVKEILDIDFGMDHRTPLSCRNNPKFGQYFDHIWKELGMHA